MKISLELPDNPIMCFIGYTYRLEPDGSPAVKIGYINPQKLIDGAQINIAKDLMEV